MRELLSVLAGLLFLAGFVPYIGSIVRGKTRPMRASWLVWLTIDVTALAGMWVKDAVNGQILGAVTGAFFVFALSLKYGKGGWTRVDQWSLAGAAGGIGLWWVFDSPVLGILATQVTGLIGTIPTFVNVWNHPQDEPRVGWLIFWLSCLPAVLAIPAFGWEHIIQPIGFLIGNSTMMYLLFVRPRFAKRAVATFGSA